MTPKEAKEKSAINAENIRNLEKSLVIDDSIHTRMLVGILVVRLKAAIEKAVEVGRNYCIADSKYENVANTAKEILEKEGWTVVMTPIYYEYYEVIVYW